MFMQDQLYRIVKNLKKILQFLDKKLCRTSGVMSKLQRFYKESKAFDTLLITPYL